MSEFEQFRCMISSEDTKDEGPAYCNYPKCWLGECPHKQARDCLAEAEKLTEKWRKRAHDSEDIYDIIHSPALGSCANELEAALRGEAEEK